MKYGLFCLSLLLANFLFGQKAIITDASGQETVLETSGYEVKSGQLILLNERGKKINVPVGEGSSIVLNDGLRFSYFNYYDDKPAQAGFFQQLTAGALMAFDFGKNGLLVKGDNGGKILLVPLSRNKPVLTYLLRECPSITAESLEEVNTNGLKNILTQIHGHNRCIDASSAELLFKPGVYATKLAFGPVIGVKLSTLNRLDREVTIREATGSHVGPVFGLEVRKKIGRSPFGLRGQALISEMNIKNDSLPILFNNNTFEKYELKGLNLQFNRTRLLQFTIWWF